MGFTKRTLAIAMLLALCALPVAGRPALAAPRVAAASVASQGGPTMDGLRTLYRYTSCAMGIAKSHEGVGLTAAVLYCLTLLQETLT